MNILITGAKGFIGSNLREWLRQRRPEDNVFSYDIIGTGDLPGFCRSADFVFHLAGVNRPQDPSEFETGNRGLTEEVLAYCREGKKPPVLITSSVQAMQDNPYGKSKKAAEDAVFAYGEETGSRVYVYRLPGVFGKWCRPNYNSVVATFCHNIARGLPIAVNDPEAEINLAYIDDVAEEFISALEGQVSCHGDFCTVSPVHSVKLGQLASLLDSFKVSRKTLSLPDFSEGLEKKLYSTYLSYLPENEFACPLKMNTDHRGSFTEFIRSDCCGQVSVNISKPGITKGNHWHHTKVEKFLVVSGRGIIRIRAVSGGDVSEYHVSGGELTVVDIPPGYTHNIENTGSGDMVTVMWANECFDPKNPDTFAMEV